MSGGGPAFAPSGGGHARGHETERDPPCHFPRSCPTSWAVSPCWKAIRAARRRHLGAQDAGQRHTCHETCVPVLGPLKGLRRTDRRLGFLGHYGNRLSRRRGDRHRRDRRGLRRSGTGPGARCTAGESAASASAVTSVARFLFFGFRMASDTYLVSSFSIRASISPRSLPKARARARSSCPPRTSARQNLSRERSPWWRVRWATKARDSR